MQTYCLHGECFLSLEWTHLKRRNVPLGTAVPGDFLGPVSFTVKHRKQGVFLDRKGQAKHSLKVLVGTSNFFIRKNSIVKKPFVLHRVAKWTDYNRAIICRTHPQKSLNCPPRLSTVLLNKLANSSGFWFTASERKASLYTIIKNATEKHTNLIN